MQLQETYTLQFVIPAMKERSSNSPSTGTFRSPKEQPCNFFSPFFNDFIKDEESMLSSPSVVSESSPFPQSLPLFAQRHSSMNLDELEGESSSATNNTWSLALQSGLRRLKSGKESPWSHDWRKESGSKQTKHKSLPYPKAAKSIGTTLSCVSFSIDPALFIPIGFDDPYVPELSFAGSEIGLQTISPETLHTYMHTEEARSRILVVDCRFEYEFAGGHISGAMNICSPEAFEEVFFGDKEGVEELM